VQDAPDEDAPSAQEMRDIIPEPEVPEEPLTGIWRWQTVAAACYASTQVQVGVACLIGGNFFTNMIEKTVDPFGTEYTKVFEGFELFYNICFTMELMLNMYSSWLWKFWKSGWNVFDFVVVSIGILTTINVPLPGPLKMLRMMRAFRVFRLFKRIESLRKIMASLARAVPGVINACIIQVIVMCIYAIIGVEVFRLWGEDGTYTNDKGQPVEFESARGLHFGWEYFGNFPKALYTMFQVLTGESWSEQIARTLMYGEEMPFGIAASLYFASFSVINGIILINVVVAVLLEKMTSEDEDPPPDEVPPLYDSEAEGEGDPATGPGLRKMVTMDSKIDVTGVTKSGKARLTAALAEVRLDLEDVQGLMDAVIDALQKNRRLPGSAPDEGLPARGCPSPSPRASLLQ